MNGSAPIHDTPIYCLAVTASGKLCSRRPVYGTDWCRQHLKRHPLTLADKLAARREYARDARAYDEFYDGRPITPFRKWEPL